MLDDDSTTTPTQESTAPETGSPDSGSPEAGPDADTGAAAPVAKKAAAKKTAARRTAAKKTTTKKAAAKKTAAPVETAPGETPADEAAPADVPADAPADEAPAPAKKTAAKRTATRKTAAKKTAPVAPVEEPAAPAPDAAAADAEEETEETEEEAAARTATPAVPLLFKAPEVTTRPARRPRKTAAAPAEDAAADADTTETGDATADDADADATERPPRTRNRAGGGRGASRPQGDAADTAEDRAEDRADRGERADEGESDDTDGDDGEPGGARRRRRRGGRRRRKSGDGDNGADAGSEADSDSERADEKDEKDTDRGTDGSDEIDEQSGEGTGSRRRRRRRRAGDTDDQSGDEPANTVTRVRKPRSAEDEITAISGSTRLEAKKQRRRDGREAGRRRAPIVSEAEFLARREAVDRVMVIRQHEDLTQIAVLEDKVLVEHYVARESQTSLIGNVYVGRVQNVLPSMEAAFIDIGKGRNAVLYAGEVNWSALGHKDGQPRKIESVLSSGQSVLVQVTKDPIGHKGARLTSQVSLAGRFLVYVPDGTTSGISRKLPDTERTRLKTLLKEIVPDTAGVIVRTAAEGASEDELTRDVERLKARWEDIEKNAKSGSAPKLLYGEPDLTLKVVRDLFTEDFSKLVIEGDEAWDTVQQYVGHVAPDLQERLGRFEREDSGDVFATYRIDEQIAKGLDRKVWLPSGGSLIIDRTEAMTVVDVNTGKFTGSGGNLEETVTKNNLEAAEEIVRQLRLRDIGGIIVVDFIDMVLESNRDLVLRRLVECLGRDRTRHQVAEVTSLGLVQMTRKRIGTGLLEAFSENCDHCQGRGLIVHDVPVENRRSDDGDRRGGSGRRNRGRGRGDGDGNDGGSSNRGGNGGNGGGGKAPSPKDVAAVAKPENADRRATDEDVEDQQSDAVTEAVEPVAAEATAAEATTADTSTPDATTADTTTAGVATSDEGSDERPEPGTRPVSTRTRTRRSGSRRSGTATPASEEAPAEAAPAEAAPAEAASAEESPAEAPAAEAPAVDENPAETPAVEAPVAPAAEEAAPDEQPVTPALAPEADAEPAAPPAAPRVVTRTRRRSASRPAGPPSVVPAGEHAHPTGDVPLPSLADAEPHAGSGQPADHGMVEPGTVGFEPGTSADGEQHPELHVPIKKKGSRKR